MKPTYKPTLWTSVLIGAGLTAALIAIFYLVQQLVGTAYPPFDVFDWVSRIEALGGLIRFGIETMVNIITTLNLGPLASVAKTAEQTMAVLGMFVTGTVVATALYEILPRARVKISQIPMAGLITGLILGVPVMLISANVNLNSSQSEFVNAVWILLGFIVWGLALAGIYTRLTVPRVTNAPQDASVEAVDRRQFLVRLGSATAAITLVGAGLGAALQRNTEPNVQVASTTDPTGNTASLQPWSATHKLPNDGDPVIPAPGTRPELTPVSEHYRIDINTIPPSIQEAEWTLSIGGLVDTPYTLTLADLKKKYKSQDQFITLECISNPLAGELIGTTRWTGISLKQLVADMKLKPNATHLKITSADNFDEFVDLDTINKDERVMLTYEWDGLPLAVDHGFPLRIYIPNHYGMKQPKWITTIEAVDAWQPGWWVRRGWDKDAIMEATSVIDTVAVDQIVTKDDAKLIPIGGIAHAGSRGISKVELKIDDGEWVEAQLRKPMSEVTWVIWRYDWPFAEGSHNFTVRCYDGAGTAQVMYDQGPGPGGATGYDHASKSV